MSNIPKKKIPVHISCADWLAGQVSSYDAYIFKKNGLVLAQKICGFSPKAVVVNQIGILLLLLYVEN